MRPRNVLGALVVNESNNVAAEISAGDGLALTSVQAAGAPARSDGRERSRGSSGDGGSRDACDFAVIKVFLRNATQEIWSFGVTLGDNVGVERFLSWIASLGVPGNFPQRC
jgi:hypothetical protein